MSEDLKRVITEEPFLGWLRIEVEGEKPFYKSPFPRTVLTSAAKLRDFLEKEHSAGRLNDVDESQFTFKRKLGLRQTSGSLAANIVAAPDEAEVPSGSSEDASAIVVKDFEERRSVVELLTRNPDIEIDHRKLLSNMSRKVDKFRPSDAYETPTNFEDLKRKVSDSADLKELLANLTEKSEVVDSLSLMFTDLCLAEISQVDTNNGPLVEFPGSVNENCYCKIADYGMERCPRLMSIVIALIVRREEPVLSKDVLKIATLFSNLCYAVNRDINAMVKLRSLTMQVDGMTNQGLDILSDVGLCQCARSLSNHRDLFAAVGWDVMNSTAANFPYQSTLDNCDLQSEHLTVEVVEKETVDTSNLSTAKITKNEALDLFTPKLVLLNTEENNAEKEHFENLVAVAVGRILASRRQEAKKLAKFLPAHHTHQNSDRKLTPALTFILKPYPYQETKNPDTIKLLIRIQRQFLQAVARSKGDDPEFIHLLKVLEDADADNEEREKAEDIVKKEVDEYGEWIGHGDLLTVKMIQEARMLMVGSATAFGRLEFLGPFRLQLLHMKMKKICQDYSVGMKNEINFDDKISLPWLTALTRMKVTNKAKEIKKNDSSFERHDQFLAEVQTSYLVNMFDNYLEKNKDKLEAVNDKEASVAFVWGMLDAFNIQLFYDPSKQEQGRQKGEDDMFIYCKDMVTRFLLSLAFDVCEEEGDAEGLRALRRIMVSYFLAKKPERQDSKYAAFTTIDLVVELAASERTHKRMDLYVVINPSGTSGGGLFRDKFEEHCVRAVKGCLRGTHGGIDDIKLEKEIGGLSVLTEVVQHNRRSVLRARVGKEHAKDLVGDRVRDQLEENVAKFDPFNRQRDIQHTYFDKSKGGPFVGLTEPDLDRFLVNKKKEYNSKYQ